MSELEIVKDLKNRGKYVPPARLKAALEEAGHATDEQEQEMKWRSLEKSINGLVNKANGSNLQSIIVELFKLNLIRGRGLLVRSCMRSQSAAIPYTPVYASLICCLNSKIPEIGILILSRTILLFRKSYKANDKVNCKSSLALIAHLCNFQVAHEILALEILQVLLESPTDDSVELTCEFLTQCGEFLTEVNGSLTKKVFEQLRMLLQEGHFSKKVQHTVQEMFKVRRDGYKKHPAIPQELDLTAEEDMLTHTIGLGDRVKSHDELNEFRYDETYQENEAQYEVLKREILGYDSDEEEEEEDEEQDEGEEQEAEEEIVEDLTEKALSEFQKNVYLIIMSSMSHSEAVHKLLRLKAEVKDFEYRLADMVVKCCSQEKTYTKYYGLIGDKLCGFSRKWEDGFKRVFAENYDNVHMFETNSLRNISKFWGHMLASDMLGWEVFSRVVLDEENTNSASRVFLKFLFQEMVAELGIPTLKQRIGEEYIQAYISGLFPQDGDEHLRFAINYFTAIGLGALTEEMRRSLSMHERSRSRSASSDASNSRSRSGSRKKRRFVHEDA